MVTYELLKGSLGFTNCTKNICKLVCQAPSVVWAIGSHTIVLHYSGCAEVMKSLLADSFTRILCIDNTIELFSKCNDVMNA